MATTGASLPKEDLKRIENCKAAAKHHEEAARHHKEATEHYEAGDHEKAFESTVKAHKHSWYAQKWEMAEVKRHALIDAHNGLIARVFI